MHEVFETALILLILYVLYLEISLRFGNRKNKNRLKVGVMMTPEKLWATFLTQHPQVKQTEMEAWAFGGDPDGLADLVVKGIKTATASAYDFYALDKEPIPQAGTYDVILDGRGKAVCVIKITKVSVLPFNQVSAEHAFKEGEGDKSLAYWRHVHGDFFRPYFEEAGLTFTEDSLIVCEKFELVFHQSISDAAENSMDSFI